MGRCEWEGGTVMARCRAAAAPMPPGPQAPLAPVNGVGKVWTV